MKSRSLIAVDVETSGPDPFEHRVLAIALVPFDESVPPLEVFVRHEDIAWTSVGREYFERYQEAWNRGAVDSATAYARLGGYLRDFSTEMKLVGHNVGFDFAFLKQLASIAGGSRLPNLSYRAVDTHTLLQLLAWLGRIPEQACSSDGALAHFDIDVPESERHTALGDAKATVKLLKAVVAEFKRSPLGHPPM